MIRRVRRTVVLEYVTDRDDDNLPDINPRDIGSGRVVSEVLDVVDAKVDPKVVAVEALASQGVDTKDAEDMYDRQRAAYEWEVAEKLRAEIVAAAAVVAKAAFDEAERLGGDADAAARAAYDAEKARLEAEQQEIKQ